MKPKSVYVPVSVEDEMPARDRKILAKSEFGSYKTTNGYHIQSNHCTHWLKEQSLYCFTKEELDQYAQSLLSEKDKEIERLKEALEEDIDIKISFFDSELKEFDAGGATVMIGGEKHLNLVRKNAMREMCFIIKDKINLIK